jgi:hypothetical protein
MIKIKKSQTADTRTCDWSKVTKEQLLESTQSHLSDIRKGFDFFIYKMMQQSAMHDLTKLSHIDDFYRNFKTGFKEKDWWELHQEKERHHFNDPRFIQDDINLIDVLDQIIDGVMAGMARSGTYRQENISPELLLKAYHNTVKLLLAEVVVEYQP